MRMRPGQSAELIGKATGDFALELVVR